MIEIGPQLAETIRFIVFVIVVLFGITAIAK
jgi:hypothetical protein